MSNDEFKNILKNGVKEFASVFKEASSSCKNNTSSSCQNVTPTKQPVSNTHTANNQIVPVNGFIPVTNTLATNNFADYLFRALRNVPSSINLQSQHSAHNIQVLQKEPYEFHAKLYKNDASVEISNSKFIFEIQPWLNNSLSTVRSNAQRDLTSINQSLVMHMTNLKNTYNMNVAQHPYNIAFINNQYQIKQFNAKCQYDMQVASIQHLLSVVQVINLKDCGDYVYAIFRASDN